MTNEKREWLSRPPREDLSRKLGIVAWVLTAVVLGLVGLMRTVRIPLPEGMSFAFLPPVHAVLNSLVAIALLVAIVAIKQGKVRLHRNAIFTAMGLSIGFLLCYVAYHFTTEETRYGGTGAMRGVYFFPVDHPYRARGDQLAIHPFHLHLRLDQPLHRAPPAGEVGLPDVALCGRDGTDLLPDAEALLSVTYFP